MRVNQRLLLRYRAAFGVGFMVLGAVTLWRVAAATAPATNKIIGALLAVAMIGLGLARIMQYVRGRGGAGA